MKIVRNLSIFLLVLWLVLAGLALWAHNWAQFMDEFDKVMLTITLLFASDIAYSRERKV